MKTFNQIAEDILKIKESDLRDDLTSNDVPDWDSMNYLLFIAELEKEFGFSFTMNEVMDVKTVGDLRKIVELKKK